MHSKLHYFKEEDRERKCILCDKIHEEKVVFTWFHHRGTTQEQSLDWFFRCYIVQSNVLSVFHILLLSFMVKHLVTPDVIIINEKKADKPQAVQFSVTQIRLRVDTSLGFNPENCWSEAHAATSHSQTRTRRTPPMLTLTDMSACIIAWGGEGHKAAYPGHSCLPRLVWGDDLLRPVLLADTQPPPGRDSVFLHQNQRVTFCNLLLLLRAAEPHHVSSGAFQNSHCRERHQLASYFILDRLAGCFKALDGDTKDHWDVTHGSRSERSEEILVCSKVCRRSLQHLLLMSRALRSENTL